MAHVRPRAEESAGIFAPQRPAGAAFLLVISPGKGPGTPACRPDRDFIRLTDTFAFPLDTAGGRGDHRLRRRQMRCNRRRGDSGRCSGHS
jgi:hypothetical protein